MADRLATWRLESTRGDLTALEPGVVREPHVHELDEHAVGAGALDEAGEFLWAGPRENHAHRDWSEVDGRRRVVGPDADRLILRGVRMDWGTPGVFGHGPILRRPADIRDDVDDGHMTGGGVVTDGGLPDGHPPHDARWDRLLALPTRRAGDLTAHDIPTGPGVYLWQHRGKIAYVGTASNLANRIWRRHLAGGRSLGSSSLRRDVAEHLLGIPTTETLRGRRKLTLDEVARVREWLRACELSWQETSSAAEAGTLEKELRGIWLPPLNRI